MYSLESPHRGDSNEYTQHTIIVYKIEKISLNYRYLLPELVPRLTLSGSNHPCLEQFSMVPKMFEPLKFDCIMIKHNPWGRDNINLKSRVRDTKSCSRVAKFEALLSIPSAWIKSSEALEVLCRADDLQSRAHYSQNSTFDLKRPYLQCQSGFTCRFFVVVVFFFFFFFFFFFVVVFL